MIVGDILKEEAGNNRDRNITTIIVTAIVIVAIVIIVFC